jgi:hypothetical protein
MRVQDLIWNSALFSITDGRTHDIKDWGAVGQYFEVIITQAVAIAQFFFCFSLPILAPCSFVSRSSVDSCLEQTRESSQLQLARVEKSRDSFIGGVCMYETYQMMVKLPWAI